MSETTEEYAKKFKEQMEPEDSDSKESRVLKDTISNDLKDLADRIKKDKDEEKVYKDAVLAELKNISKHLEFGARHISEAYHAGIKIRERDKEWK